MRSRLLLCAALACAVSCVKRVAPSAGEDRTTTSGVRQSFGGGGEVPSGSEVTWDFGDGTPPAKGSSVEHAFPHAGAFTVTETIRDKDGEQRTSQAHVTVLRRSVPMALPADVRSALVVQSPWAKLSLHRAVAERLSLGNFFDEVARTLSDALGFDALNPKALDANGFDPDEGTALYTVPQDPEALVMAVGTSDDVKALAAVRRMLQRGGGRVSGGPYQLTEAKLADGTSALLGVGAGGEKVGVIQRYGYLYIRTAGLTDPLVALASAAALPPDKGLAVEQSWLTALRHVGQGDAVFYSRGAPPGADGEGRARLAGELGSLTFSVSDRPDLLQVKLFSELKNLKPPELAEALKPAKAPPDLAARLPPGAAGYLKLSASPTALWKQLVRAAGADASRARDRVQESTGLDVEKDLLPSFTGNVGVALYLDASSLIEALMGEQVASFDRSSFLAVAELAQGNSLQAALDRATKGRAASDRLVLKGGGIFWRLGDAAQAAIKDGFFFLSLGGPPLAAKEAPAATSKRRPKPPPPQEPTPAQLGALGPVLLAAPGDGSLSESLKRAGLRGFDVPSQQDAWLDIGGIVLSIQRAAEGQGGMAQVAAGLLSERAAGLRDAQAELRPGADGAEADLWIRFPAGSEEASTPPSAPNDKPVAPPAGK